MERMKAKLDELNADLDRWEAMADQAKAQGRGGIRRAGGGLRQKRDELEPKITEAQEAAHTPLSEAHDMTRIGHLITWITLVLLAGFALLNWPLLTEPASLDLLVTRAYAPPGLVLLGLTAIFVVVFFLTAISGWLGGLQESHRLHQELESARELAQEAEESRFSELQAMLAKGMEQLNDRLDRLEKTRGKTDPQKPAGGDMNTREEYIQKLKSKLDEWDDDLATLETNAEKAEGELKREYSKQIEAIKERRQEAMRKLDELRSASEDAWEDLKEGMETSWEAMDEAVEEAVARFQ